MHIVSLYNDFKHTTIEIVVSFTRVAKVPLVHSQFSFNWLSHTFAFTSIISITVLGRLYKIHDLNLWCSTLQTNFASYEESSWPFLTRLISITQPECWYSVQLDTALKICYPCPKLYSHHVSGCLNLIDTIRQQIKFITILCITSLTISTNNIYMTIFGAVEFHHISDKDCHWNESNLRFVLYIRLHCLMDADM